MSADRLIVKFHPQAGAALWSLETQAFVLDAEGQPVKADPKTGKALSDTPARPRPASNVKPGGVPSHTVQHWNAHETGSSTTLDAKTERIRSS